MGSNQSGDYPNINLVPSDKWNDPRWSKYNIKVSEPENNSTTTKAIFPEQWKMKKDNENVHKAMFYENNVPRIRVFIGSIYSPIDKVRRKYSHTEFLSEEESKALYEEDSKKEIEIATIKSYVYDRISKERKDENYALYEYVDSRESWNEDFDGLPLEKRPLKTEYDTFHLIGWSSDHEMISNVMQKLKQHYKEHEFVVRDIVNEPLDRCESIYLLGIDPLVNNNIQNQFENILDKSKKENKFSKYPLCFKFY